MDKDLPTEITELDALRLEAAELRVQLAVQARTHLHEQITAKYEIGPGGSINGSKIMRPAPLQSVNE